MSNFIKNQMEPEFENIPLVKNKSNINILSLT